MDGKSVWLIDTFQGTGEKILSCEKREHKFTTIRMKDDETILIGTFNGSIILKTTENTHQIVSDSSISHILDEACFADVNGRLYFDNQIVIDDGVLQPCALLQSKYHIYFVKHRTIYVLVGRKLPVKSVTLETSGYFCAAELDYSGILYACTDTGELLSFDPVEPFRLKSHKSDAEIESDTSDADDSSSEEESTVKSERILSLIQNPNDSSELLLLKSNPANKNAWFEYISIPHSETDHSPVHIPDFETIPVACPLCDHHPNQQQQLKLNASSCSTGHPITVCCLTKNLIESPSSCFRCRNCNASYSIYPPFCQFCNNLITK